MAYPFLDDIKTVTYLKHSKVMIFLSGFDRDNKASSLSVKLSETYPDSSAVFQFPNLVMKSVEDAVKDGVRMIIIDNASEVIDDMQELYTFALKNHYIEMAIKSGIGESTYEPISPTFFGWFLNEADSKELRQYGKKVLKDSFHVKDFADDFRKHCEEPSIKDLTSYFTADYIDVGDTMLHCTSMYHAQDGFKEYTKRVAGHIGQVFSIKVLGFLITPRTFGARLKLDNGALTLWDSTDHPDTKQWEPSFFSPTNGRGSRAHLSLLTAPGVKAVETGVDLTELVKLEVETQHDENIPTTPILNNTGVLRCYGKGRAILYLKEPVILSFLMSGCNLKC